MNSSAPSTATRGSALVPPPPTGSILQKQSSFTRTKPAASGSDPAGATATAQKSLAASASMAATKAPALSPSAASRGGAPASGSAVRPGGESRSAMTAPNGVSKPSSSIAPSAGAGSASRPTASPARPIAGGPSAAKAASPGLNAAPRSGPPGMWGPSGMAPTQSSASSALSAGRPASGGGSGTGSVSSLYGPSGGMGKVPSALGRSGSFNQMSANNMYGSMGVMRSGSFGPGAAPSGFGSMTPSTMAPGSMMMMRGAPTGSAYGSMAPGPFGSLGGSQFNSMRGPNGYGSMGGSMANMSGYQQQPFGSNRSGMVAAPNGSMFGMPSAGMMGSQYGSMYGPAGMMGGSMYGPAAMMGGSMYGPMGMMGSMYRPMGSMYGPMGGGMTSAYGFAAQWGSLANINGGSIMGAEDNTRSVTGSAYGGFQLAKAISLEDICPVIDNWENAPELKRSGRRGGNKLYSQDKKDKTAIRTSNSQSTAMTIKHKKLLPSEEESARLGSLRLGRAGSLLAGDRPRAKVPTNFDVHTLIVVDKTAPAARACVTVADTNTVRFEKDDKKERFECDEALEHDAGSGELDSVLLSELRGNWLSGHNSSLLLAAGEGKARTTEAIAKAFVQKCVTRIASETTGKGGFDVSINMAALRGADLCADLLKKGADFAKIKLGSSPVYGPCILDLTTRRAKSAKECVEVLESGLGATKASGAEVTVAFLVLKHYKQGASEKEVHLSSLCLGFFQQNGEALVEIKEKASSAPHRLFRYAVGGASLTVSLLCISNSDAKARGGLEVERKMRLVKNSPPRSGNVKRFIEYTEKEIARQKDKLSGASGSEKTVREAQIKRMEEMVKDAKEIYKNPESTHAKGYSLGS